MYLNTLSCTAGSRKTSKRVGRGIGSTLGKTCGRGHKGQKSRSGGFNKVGFEGGQMPLQRRLPKVGFTSRVKKFYAQVRLSEIESLRADEITKELLIQNNIVPSFTKKIKIIKSGEISRAVIIKGLAVTSGAKIAVETAGGKIEG